MGWLSRFFSDPIGALTDNKVTETVTNTVKNIIEDPLPTIVNVGLMALGVPPVLAGAAGGLTSAAEHGGDLLQGAITGGAMGYAGGTAAGLAGEAGLGAIGQGAVGGAASGATGALLTGGDIIQSALGGGLGGAASAGLQQMLGTGTPNQPAPIEERGTINGVPVSGPVSPDSLGTGLTMNNQGTGFNANGQNISTGQLGNSTLGNTDYMPTGTSGSPYDLVSATGTGGLGLQQGGGLGLQTSGGTGLQVGGNTGVMPISPLPEVTSAGDLYGLSPTQVSALNSPSSTTTPGGVPLIPLIAPTPKGKPATSTGTFKFGDVTPLQIPTGLNPGMIQPTPYYATTSPDQARYYWGKHDYQTGDTFNPNSYNVVEGAPTEAWGNQKLSLPQSDFIPTNPYAPVSTQGMLQTNPTPANTPTTNLATSTAQPVLSAMPTLAQEPVLATAMAPVTPETPPVRYVNEGVQETQPYMLPPVADIQQPQTFEAMPVIPNYQYENPMTYDQYFKDYTQAMGTEPVNPEDVQTSWAQYQAQNPTMFAQPQPA